jgi:small-conductance mechanosensitive channel
MTTTAGQAAPSARAWYRGGAKETPRAAVLLQIENLPSWALAAAYVAFWAGAAALVRRGLRRWLTKLAASQPSELTEILAATLPRPAAVAVFLVALTSGIELLPLREHLSVEVQRWLGGALAILGVGAVMRVVLHAIDAHGRLNPALKSSAGVGKAVIWMVGLAVTAVLVSDALGISLAPALTALGVGSLAVALALQDTLSNFFSGLYLVVDKPVRPGDFIRVDPTYEGYVDAIGWRTTHLRTLQNNLVVIPNATLSKAIITNYSLPTQVVASSIRIDVGPDADIDKVEDALADEARRAVDLPGMAVSPKPDVALSPGFVDGVIAFTVAFHVEGFTDQGRVQHVLRKRIAARLKREGVPLASGLAALLRSK